jgi:hypothetical protein
MSKFPFEIDKDKLNTVRRKMSFDNNEDLSNGETIKKLIEREFSLIDRRKKLVLSDGNSKMHIIKRKLSHEVDQDLTFSQVLSLLVERAYSDSQRKVYTPTKVNLQLIYEELSKGTTVEKCAENLGVSKMTIFRAKAKLREMNI